MLRTSVIRCCTWRAHQTAKRRFSRSWPVWRKHQSASSTLLLSSTVMMLRGSSSALSLPSARSSFAPAIGAWTMVADVR